jgi:hypothetical protein
MVDEQDSRGHGWVIAFVAAGRIRNRNGKVTA